MKIVSLCVVLWLGVFSPFCLNAQNLVVNPSFEIVPDRLNPGEYPVSKAYGWSMPTRAQGSLYFSLSAFAQLNQSLQKWAFKARTGQNVAALATFGTYKRANQKAELREYVQGSLSERLTVGQKYYIEYWVHFHCEGTNNIGVAFLTQPISTPSVERLKVTPLVNHSTVIPYSATLQWHLVRDSFVAREAFSHFIIGNFKTNNETQVQSNTLAYHKAYIDDVAVFAAEDSKMPPKVFDVDIDVVSTQSDKHSTQNTGNTVPSPVVATPVKGEVLILDKVLFKFNSANLESQSTEQLDKLVQLMRKHKTMTVHVKGHTSSEGSAEYNQKLSEQRAKVVVDYLIEKGIEAQRLTSTGFGFTQPLVSNDSEQGKAKNRRVEFEVVQE